jgi:1-acyl-sn-glycerol-3-phosphate acyltransferase
MQPERDRTDPLGPGSPPDRAALAQQIAAMLGPRIAPEADALRDRILELLAGHSDADLARFFERLRTTGESWSYHAPDPLARAVSRAVMMLLLEAGSALEQAERLAIARQRPAILLANHLSFVDANVLDALLCQAGFADLADRLTVLVGPKVFSRPLRRLASLCFGTLKIPQSSSRASGEALMAPREVARLASDAVRIARERQEDCGDQLLVFIEGTRSRSGQMQRALAGVDRYLDHPAAVLVGLGLWGSERLVPIAEDEHLQRPRVRARVAPLIESRALRAHCGRNRALAMDTVGFLIADSLPESYRGVYAGSDPALREAREIARAVVAEAAV